MLQEVKSWDTRHWGRLAESNVYCAGTDPENSCPKAEPRGQRGCTLYTLASRLQKQKAKLNPLMAACDFIGYFISPVLCDLHVSILCLSLCFAIPSLCLVVRTQSVSFLPPPLSCYITTEPNWGRLQMQKGQTIEDRHAESWGQVCWALGWRHTTASSLLFSINSPLTSLLFSIL
jgi:hypothetical protein